MSNNSASAIEAYLGAHRLTDRIAFVSGRAYAQPDRMKPHPEPLWRAATALKVAPEVCVCVCADR
ncbi:hypothetical protein AB0M46_29815 [Dactylosporangium sp. NPDC051485]|uniref:hypothetical protein n=1 Tax=Dactylosporangium sp. NPDC051485 TaxID=3154846 RepID=UPI00343ED759